MKKTLILMCIFLLSGCRLVLDGDYDRNLKATDFAISDEISGWKEESFATYNDPISLQNLIDGGYNVYTDNGMVEGIRQKMVSTGSKSSQVYVMDFGSLEQASAEYRFMSSRATNIRTVPGYADTVAAYTSTVGGITVFSHFDKFYFEIALNGYTTETQAKSAALLFLGVYEQKVTGDME